MNSSTCGATDDLHLLPYDGIADWDYNIQRLRMARHQPILNFELNTTSKPNRHENDIYAGMETKLSYISKELEMAKTKSYDFLSRALISEEG